MVPRRQRLLGLSRLVALGQRPRLHELWHHQPASCGKRTGMALLYLHREGLAHHRNYLPRHSDSYDLVVSAWEFCVDKGGVSALTLKRRLGLGSYETAWTMLHRYRSAMMLSGVDKLSGTVEVDETFLGGVRPGKRGRGALGKVMVIIAVELKEPRGYGRTRMRVIPNARGETIKQFLLDNVELGSTIVSDGHRSYPPATRGNYVNVAHAVKPSGKQAHTMLPAVHRVALLLKRWFLGTN